MRNYILFLVFLVFLSCSNKEKNTELPIDNVVVKDSVIPNKKVVIPTKEELIFTVQIAALEKQNNSLRALKEVQIFNENGLTKYRLGRFSSYQEADSLKLQLQKKYQGVFIQALKNNKPIHIKEALAKN
ncbi:SPOR domain-containing protein [Polaribacter tangerinus]|uniref:SPOR domain-containing protein n=1 Tax=Polaribacter tangerinus TaxID=1920034 RepID=UPI000B4C15FE|nr:SPOR domain-containing protein [Polaribacter tangerinus]